jgi:hypothetical protein
MRNLSRGATLAVLAGAALLGAPAPARPQGKAEIDVRVVKYDGLGEEVARHRGKVVLVDFWAEY